MENSNKSIRNWHIFGAFFLIIAGTIFHFVYDWSNCSTFVGIFTPVNESIWEHLKLGFTPLLIYSLFEYPFIKKDANNYFLAKAVGIISFELIVVIGFYIYSSITGHSILFIDITLFIIGCIVCQKVSYKLMTREPLPKCASIIGLILLIINFVCFIVFTFNPPKLTLFKDSKTGQYGIEQKVN